MALRDVQAVVTITTNATKAIDDGKKLRETYKATLDIIKQFRTDGKIDTPEGKELLKLADDLQAKIKALVTGMDLIRGVADNLANKTGKDVNRAMREISKEFNKTANETDADKQKLKELSDTLAKLKEDKSIRQGLTMPLEEARQQLNNLVNTPTDKLRMGLAAIRKEMEKEPANTQWSEYLKRAETKYKAQIAVREQGPVGNANIPGAFRDDAMNMSSKDRQQALMQMQAEQQRLRSLFTATDGVEGFDVVNQDALDRLHQVNQAVTNLTEAERHYAQEKQKSQTAFENSNKALDVTQRLQQGQKVTLQELIETQKHYNAELQKFRGVNLSPQDEQIANMLKTRLEQVETAMRDITGVDLNKVFANLDGQKLSTLEQALKQVKEQAAQIKVGDETQIKQTAQQIEVLEAKIAEAKQKLGEGIANALDFDNLQDVPTEKLEQALKQLEQQEKRLIGTDTAGAQKMAENKRKVQEQINRNRRAVQDYANAEKVAANTGKHNVTELKAAYETLQQKLMGLNTGQKREIEATRQQMKKLKSAIDETTGAIGKQSGIWSTAVKNITAYVGVFGAFNFVKSKLQEVVRGGEELSDQMAQIRMVSGLTMEDIEELTRHMAQMDTRTTLQELGRIAYAGAKLGFGEKGIQGLEEFTRAANQVNVALREDLGEEALTALSKITENMGLIKKMGVEDAMLATSSAMFKLAATSTAAAGPIVEVTKRLAPVAQMSGFATHEILALASASDSLQLMPEVVGTALSKLIMAMQNNHNLIEKYLSIPEGTIASLFKAGQSMDALMLVFEKMSGKNVTELDGLWKLLGSDGQRLITVVADMANHTDTLAKHLDTSTKAFKEATAVTEEYNIQQETAMAYLLRAQNLWRNAFINPDSSLSVKEMTKAWYDFTKSILSSDVSMGAIKLTVDALLLSLRLLIALLPAITFGLLAKGAAMLAEKLKMAKIFTDGFTLSWKKMDAATKSNWIGLAVGGLMQLVYWTKEWISSTSDAEKEQKKMEQAIENMRDKQDQEIGNLDRLKKQLDNTNISQEERNALLQKVRTDYDIYLNYLGIEKNAVTDLTKHYDALVKVMKQRFAYQEREDYKRDVMGGEDGLRMNRRRAGSNLSKQGNNLGVNADLDMIATYVKNGKSAGDIYGLMFADIKAAENAALRARPSGAETYATPGAAATASNDYDHSYSNFRKALEGYVKSVQQEIKKEAEIDAAFASEIGDFDYDKWLRTQVTGEFKVQPDKEAARAARKAQQEEKQAFRKDLQDAQRESDAIIAKIEEWYRLQETVITDMQNDGKLTKEQADQAVRTLNIAKNTALRDARLAVSGRDTKAWETTKQQIGNLMLDQGQWSQELLQQILGVSMESIRKNLSRIDKGGGQYGITTSSLKDAVDKNAAGNQREIARLQARSQQEVEKILMEYNFFDQAMRAFSDRLAQMGILTETARQINERLSDAQNPDTLFSMKDYDALLKGNEGAKQQMLQAFIRSGAQPYAVNPEDTAQLRSWFMDFVGQFATVPGASPLGEGMPNVEYQYQSWAEPFQADFELWLRNSEQYKAQIQAFYFSLMKSEQNYYENRKKQREQDQREADTRWQAYGWTAQQEQENMQYERDSALRKIHGEGQNFGQTYGFADTIAEDPEIKRIQNRMEWRQREMDDLVAKNASEEVIMQKQNEMLQEAANLAEKVSQEVANRIAKVQTLSEPLNAFGEEVGQKLGEMWQGISQEGKLTFGEMARNMGIEYAKLTIKMVSENLQKKLQQGIFYKQMEMQEMQHQVQLYNIQQAGAAARATGQLTAGATLQGIQAAQNAAEIGAEGGKATVMTMFGISEGAAKTIAKLGFWGIPLIGVITSILMGLLNSAKATASQSTESAASSSSATKMKLVSGMLTYDEGNADRVVSSPRRKLYDDGSVQVYDRPDAQRNRSAEANSSLYPGTDGHVYRATAQPSLPDGVSLVKSPIATTVNGQPSLVAERGPEIIIGRRATRHIQMNEPGLLHHLAAINGRYRTYDQGTVPAAVPLASPSGTPATTPDGAPSLSGRAGGEADARVAEALEQNTAMMLAMQQTIAALSQTVTTLQQRGIPAHIQKYGTGGLIDEVKSGLKFDARYNR